VIKPNSVESVKLSQTPGMGQRDLPPMEELSGYPAHDDLFVCALGFEDRCTEALARLSKNDYKVRNSIVLKYDAHQADNETNASQLYQLLKHVTSDAIKECEYRTSDIIGTSGQMITTISSFNFKRVAIDISSFTTGLILQILDILFQTGIDQLRILYTEAEKYYPTSPVSQDELSLSSGVRQILTLPSFSGIYYPGYSPLLIVLLGFEPIRIRGLFNAFQPSRKIGVVGIPTRSDLKWRLPYAKKIYENLFGQQDRLIELSEFDYRETLEGLEKIYAEFSQKNNIAIAPLGSKMETLATFLFLRKHPDVQLLMSLPMKYDPRRYTDGSGRTYQILFKPNRTE